MSSYELTHFKKMVRVWKTKSLLFWLRYDPLIVFRRQNHITFMSHMTSKCKWPIQSVLNLIGQDVFDWSNTQTHDEFWPLSTLASGVPSGYSRETAFTEGPKWHTFIMHEKSVTVLVFLEQRWLYRVFQGQYLRSLSTNYVAINKELEKLLLQLYTSNICYDQGYNDIRVDIATKWHHYLLAAGVFPGTRNRSRELVSSEKFALCFLQIFGRTLTLSSFLLIPNHAKRCFESVSYKILSEFSVALSGNEK